MGLIENFGKVAGTYMAEKEKLKSAGEDRQRVMIGHPLWPHEALRDTLIFCAIIAILAFYSWLIPPPLHSPADPFAQAGFVFPDWYVLFSYGYLRLGEYLPQFNIPAGPIGAFFGQPVISWSAAWWGSFITGIPVGVLALPPLLGGREKRGVEDPAFATAGVIYLAHVWFISVFSINIFLELYGKNRADYCKLDSHGDLVCGVREPWVADVFNSIPWVMTGILIWFLLYYAYKWFMVHGIGARASPQMGKKAIAGALIVAVALSAWSWPVYDNGFWDAGGFGAMEDEETLAKMRTQPEDVHVHSANEFTIDYPDDVVPARDWLQWDIYQPTREVLIDFSDSNYHQQPDIGLNAIQGENIFSGNSGTSLSGTIAIEGTYEQESYVVDLACDYRASERKIDGIATSSFMIASLVLTNSGGNEVANINGCAASTIDLPSGDYDWTFSVASSGALAANESINVSTSVSIAAYQPLLLYDNSGEVVNLSNPTLESYGIVDNPTFHHNPKGLDAKLIYGLFIPPLTVGIVMWTILRKMARGYEYEMNKCYGCDLCDSACPVRLFTGGDKLNIIYNTWNNEDDGVPLFTCLTCSACTNVCPQLVDYDSYVDIRRNLIVGGAPAAEIPHTIMQAVINAEAEAEADNDFIATADYPIDSSIGYYPGCVDYLDQEMVFSHVNDGKMNLGDSTTAAFTLFEEMGEDVAYLGRDFLKCCGHDQKWQGMTEVFDKLKAYNQKKLQASGIDTLVSSCAECFRTFAKDYELEGIKVMHTTEFLLEKGFDMNLKADDGLTVTYHDPCRLGRQMGIYDEPRDLVTAIEGVDLVEMEHHGEDALCCGVSSMMSCNENSRSIRMERFDEMQATGADLVLTSCPKCVSHFECMKFEGDPRHDIEILDIVSFLANQVNAKKGTINANAVETNEASMPTVEV
ncbi:MAG: 4Fe-4S dicluster domain-containing protein [Euryarchaeota archaeon]|nr:4Fe-4S dicluster domain-containing protein [Euryarchaeota archaeon]